MAIRLIIRHSPAHGASRKGGIILMSMSARPVTPSKTLAPALRLAWVVPPPHLIDDVEKVLLVTGVTPPGPRERSSRG